MRRAEIDAAGDHAVIVQHAQRGAIAQPRATAWRAPASHAAIAPSPARAAIAALGGAIDDRR